MKTLAIAALTLLAGCAEDPLALAPFPCAGDGTCPEALICAAGISDNAAGMCLASCTSSSECEEGSRCASLGGGVGACLAECTLFGTDCAGATSCRIQAADEGSFASCVAVTAEHGMMFGVCESAVDCPANASCVRAAPTEPPTCQPHCDAEHACRRGMICEALLPSGAGVCL